MPLSRSSFLSALQTPFEPRFLQSPPLQTSTWASWSLTFAAGFVRGGVARALFARASLFLAFLAFFLEMASSSPTPGFAGRVLYWENKGFGLDGSEYTTSRDEAVSWAV